jgi:pyruvate ferredoxin oxidoreductase gamma subunit/2-oxoisovalerate ferredoxin oxidoreductase gamma subunit
MIQIRIHGRGGQGVVTSAELLAIAGYHAGHFAQAFPFFGVERSGAPIQAFARLDSEPIIVREHVYQPDFIIIQDASLLASTDVLFGATAKTKIIINTSLNAAEILEKIKAGKVQSFIPSLKNIQALDASKIAVEILGKNIMNTTILGALAKDTDLITLEGIKAAITEKFEPKGAEIIAKNIQAAAAAFNL